MKLLQLQLKAYRGLAELNVSFSEASGAARPITVLTGPPCVGLTSVLEAIVLSAARLGGTGGLPDPTDHLRQDAAGAVLVTSWELDEEEQRRGGTRSALQEAKLVIRRAGLGAIDADPALLAAHHSYDHKPTTSKVMYFPAARVSNAAYAPIRDFENEQKQAHLLTTADKFSSLPRALMGLVLSGQNEMFDRVKALFQELAPSCRLAGLSSAGQPEFSSRSGGVVALRRLSTTERNAFVFAASSVLMGLEQSLVLLDTPETGLAAGEAARWLTVLAGSLPRAQFIVASRDAALCAQQAVVIGGRT